MNRLKKSRPRGSVQRHEVVVIGAGAAGLAAAQTLQREGIDVVVLEARKRIGGRVKTSYDLAPHPVELAAEFIHGRAACTWDFMRQFGFAAIADANHGYRFSHGTLYHDSASPLPQTEEMLAYVKQRARDHLNQGGPNISVAEFLDKFATYPLAPTFQTTRQFLNNLVASEKGADLSRMSLAGLLEHDFSGYGDHNYRIVNGYGRLLERLADGLDIRRRTPVERVDWSKRGATLYADGEIYEAARVVVTLPLAILKAGDVEFNPPLPKQKRRAIQQLGAAKVCKIILRFREKFWPDDMAVLATTEDTQVWWPSGWGRENAAPILTALVGGAAAKRFAALGKQAIPEALRQLEKMYGLDLRRGFLDGRVEAWHKHRYSKMGYSYLPVGASPELRQRLAAPLLPTLFFAGEATNMHAPSTVHGALESGQRVAQQILRCSLVGSF